MWPVEKRSWEFDFAANLNAYTGYTAVLNGTVVLRYCGISGIKVGKRQGETRWIESPIFHSYVWLKDLSPMSLSPISLSSMPLPYVSLSLTLSSMSLAHLAPLILPWLASLCLSSKRDRGDRQGSKTLKRGAREGRRSERQERSRGERRERNKGEKQRRETRERDSGERRRREIGKGHEQRGQGRDMMERDRKGR